MYELWSICLCSTISVYHMSVKRPGFRPGDKKCGKGVHWRRLSPSGWHARVPVVCTSTDLFGYSHPRLEMLL